jgi:hypothetical protein
MAVHTNLTLAPDLPVAPDRTLARRLGALGFVAVLLQSAHAAYVLAGGLDRIVTFFPDDAFYYLQVAKNFAAHGRWTFDGTAPATGFHLLWGYGWAAVFALAPRLDLIWIYVLSFGISEVCYVLAAVALGIVAVECYGSGALLAVFAVFLGTSVFMLPGLGMESAPTLLCAAVLCLLLFRARQAEREGWPRLLALYGVGLAGMLSRSDFGVFVFACLVASVLDSAWRRNLSLEAVRPAAIGFAGALSGLGVILTHCWLVSGHLFQASAQTKFFWSSLNGHSIVAPLLLLAASIVYKLPYATTLMYPLLAALAIVAVAALAHVWRTRAPGAPVLTGVLAVVGYVVLYSRDSRALQIWYVASFATPLTLIAAPAAAALAARFRAFAVVLVGVAAAGILALSVRPLWANQKGLKDAGEFLAARPELAPVGAWNAGSIGYFAGRPVTNLDGLVNDDILPYARSGTLADYVRKRQLAYIVDYGAMLGKDLSLRGGYADGLLASCLKPQMQIDAARPEQHWQDSALTLYKVDVSCLESKAKSAPR